MKILCKTSRSAAFELENNDSCYFSPEKFPVYLNGEFVREERLNVFSVFGLEPCTKYCVSAFGEEAEFITDSESGLFNVKSFNAFGDGVHDDTAAFTAAINCLPENAVLYIPQGIYCLNPLFLKSNMTIYLDKGAVLKGNTDRAQYPVLPANVNGCNFGTWQGEEADCFASLLTAINCINIKVTGEGCVDCNASSGDWYVNHRIRRIAWRPRGIFLNRCKNVVLHGISVMDTPSWNIHPYCCENVKICGLTLKNNPEMPTTDGIDPDCCNGVEIAGVDISVGDDCIALKSGTLEFAKKYKLPCRNIQIRNCFMREGHGGVVMGSELSGGIENVNITRCVFEGTDRGFRIKTRRGRGHIGQCGNVDISNIVMRDVKVPFVINMYYNMGDENGHSEYVWTTEKLSVDERTPEVGSFTFRNMTCTGVQFCAGAFYGLPESPIESVKLENVSFVYAQNAKSGFPDMREKNTEVLKQGLNFEYVRSVELSNLTFDGHIGKTVITKEVENLKEYK